MLTYRKCAPQDCQLWIALNREFMAYELEEGPLWSDADKASDQQFAQTFADALAAPELIDLFLFEEDGQPVGFANLLKVYSVWSHGRAMILDDLFIRAQYRGKGYGRQMMAMIQDHARACGCKRLQFQSETANHNARGFYSALGYQPRELYFYVKYLQEG